MLRQLLGADGVLSAPLSSTTNRLTVDSGLSTLIHSALVGSDWAYLALDDGRNVEIIKLYAPDDSGIRIERGKDATQARAFATGTKVYYTVTASEIADQFIAARLDLIPRDGIVVNNGEISYTQIQFHTLGATKVAVHEDEITLFRDEQAYGCCDGNNDPAAIPNIPIYLTSRIYPIEALDWYGTGIIKPLSGRIVNRVVDDLLETSIIVIEGDLWGGLVTHTQLPEDLVQTEFTVLEGDLWGGLVTAQADDDICITALTVLEGELWGNLIQYTHPADFEQDHLITGLTVVSGTLT